MLDCFGKEIVSPLDNLPLKLPKDCIVILDGVAMRLMTDVTLEPVTSVEHSKAVDTPQSVVLEVPPAYPLHPQFEHGREWPQVAELPASVRGLEDDLQTSPFHQHIEPPNAVVG